MWHQAKASPRRGGQRAQTSAGERNPPVALCFLERLDGFGPRQTRRRIKQQRQCCTTIHAIARPRRPGYGLFPSDRPAAIRGPSFDEDDIEGAAIEASIKVFAEPRRQLHIHLGMPADKSSKHIRQSGKDKVFRRPETQPAAQRHPSQKFVHAIVFFQNPARMFENGLTFRCDAQCMGIAIDEAASRGGLQLLEVLANGGLPQSKRTRRAAERAGGSDRCEAAEQIRVKQRATHHII